jgi:hypothetical protein
MRLNTGELNKSLNLLSAHSTRLPAYLANKAARFIALEATRNMPVVDPGTIETELNAAVELVKARRGGRYRHGMKFIRSHRLFGNLGPERAYKPEYADIPLLTLIIQARANPNSRYNALTGHVFAGPSPFKGVSREAGAAAMLATMRRVFSARKSSTGFFKAAAQLVAIAFNYAIQGSSVPPAIESGASGVDPRKAGNLTRSLGRLADVSPATGTNAAFASASFWVTTTEPDSKGQGGRALRTVAEPVWQAAVFTEAASIQAEAERRYTEIIRRTGVKVY